MDSSSAAHGIGPNPNPTATAAGATGHSPPRPLSPLGFTPILDSETHFQPPSPTSPAMEPPAGYVFMPIQPPPPAAAATAARPGAAPPAGAIINPPPPQPGIQGISRGFTPPFYATLALSPPPPAAASAPPPPAEAVPVASTGQVTAMLGHLDMSTSAAPACRAAAAAPPAAAAAAMAAAAPVARTVPRMAPGAFLAYWQPPVHSKLQVAAPAPAAPRTESPRSRSASVSSKDEVRGAWAIASGGQLCVCVARRMVLTFIYA